MSTQEQQNHIVQELARFNSLDFDKVYRENLGSFSLKESLSPVCDEIKKKIQFAAEYGNQVSETTMGHALGYFNEILTCIIAISDFSDEDFVAQKDDYVSTICINLDSLRDLWPLFQSIAIESRGWLDLEGEVQEIDRIVPAIRNETKKAIENIKEASGSILEKTKEEADAITTGARKTAAGISVEEAQKQFREAQEALDVQKNRWGKGSAVVVFVFLAACAVFYWKGIPGENVSYKDLIYISVIRVTILMAIGTVAAFCLRIYRAHLHMSEKNKHRQRVANSMEAFVNSTTSDEQRDFIFGQLVESVVQFGNSGLLPGEDDNVYRPKMTIDTILKSLSPDSQKKN